MPKQHLEVIKVKGGCRWAIKATIEGETRYRGYHYKREAERGLSEWSFPYGIFKDREFWHNFFSAEELGIQEIA